MVVSLLLQLAKGGPPQPVQLQSKLLTLLIGYHIDVYTKTTARLKNSYCIGVDYPNSTVHKNWIAPWHAEVQK